MRCGAKPDGNFFTVCCVLDRSRPVRHREAGSTDSCRKAAALSQVLGRCADAAYYRRQSRHRIVVNEAGGFVVLEALTIGFVAMVQGDIRCVGVTGDRCLWVALMTPMVMCWRFLGSTVSVLFLGSEYGSLLEFVF